MTEKIKDTIIYGGAFNPPTVAHQEILQACVDHAAEIDADVWLLPSGERTDKSIGLAPEQRVAMLRALASDVVARTVRIAINTSELETDGTVETYDTVHRFNEEYPDRNFIWVYGSDSYETMPDWHGGQWLRDNTQMIIVERAGHELYDLPENVTPISITDCGASSTEVRQRLANHLPIDALVTPSVRRFLANSYRSIGTR